MLNERDKKALQVWIGGKMLYTNKRVKEIKHRTYAYTTTGYTEQIQVHETAIFAHPDDPDQYIEMTIETNAKNSLAKASCIALEHSKLLKELAPGGDYAEFQDIPIGHPEAERVLLMFRYWVQIFILRAQCERLLIDPNRVPLLPPGRSHDEDNEEPEYSYA